MVHVKICGIRSLEAALWAAESGADALGFIMAPSSKRYIEPQLVRGIAKQLPPYIARIGVFVNTPPAEVKDLIGFCGFTGFQLHGDEEPEDYRQITSPLIKAIKVPVGETDLIINGESGYSNPGKWTGLVQGLLVDSVVAGQFGGTGHSLPWDNMFSQNLFREIKATGIPLILAGGLTLDNVSEGIRKVKPYAVDVSSGVERDGKKDAMLIQEFIKKAKAS
jgi:phosphoribosylanthranilate isomerase